MKLDIGCGRNKVVDALGIDIKNSRADIICEVEAGLPFKDDVFDEIYCNQFVEHVEDLVRLMEEIYRVGKNQAKVFINAPYYASLAAYNDPTHKRFVTKHTFDYFTENPEYNFYTKARFRIKTITFTYGIVPKILFFIPKFIFRRSPI